MEYRSLEGRCNYFTDRLAVRSWKHTNNELDARLELAPIVLEILTPNVTKSLPEGWQNISSLGQAQEWIEARSAESHLVTIRLISTDRIVGFIFLYESERENQHHDLRFGYLLSDEVWGKGLGTELLEGLINWCQAEGDIKSISGGVETDNIGSIKVLERTGFTLSQTESPTKEVVFYEYRFDI